MFKNKLSNTLGNIKEKVGMDKDESFVKSVGSELKTSFGALKDRAPDVIEDVTKTAIEGGDVGATVQSHLMAWKDEQQERIKNGGAQPNSDEAANNGE